MYCSSSQLKNWTFKDEAELTKLRIEANRKFILTHAERSGIPECKWESHFLTPSDERVFLRQYEVHMRDFCRRFNPPMPRSVIGTAFHYFKRFYLHNSVMDYHPKEMLVTCVFFACKVEEFNVSILQFVANIKGDRDKATDIILNNEMTLMHFLNYNLTVHNPFRPVEGLLIDIKTRGNLADPERLRPGIEEMLDKAFLTDVILLYTPSQIALAAILYAASKVQENLDSYVTELLIDENGKEHLANLIEVVRRIRISVKNVDTGTKEQIRAIERKLEKCRNQNNNPDSYLYKKRIQAMLDEDENDDDSNESHLAKRSRIDERMQTNSQSSPPISTLMDKVIESASQYLGNLPSRKQMMQ